MLLLAQYEAQTFSYVLEIRWCQSVIIFKFLFLFGSMLQVDIDFESEPIGLGKDGKKIFFRDIWPSSEEVAEVSLLKLLIYDFFLIKKVNDKDEFMNSNFRIRNSSY